MSTLLPKSEAVGGEVYSLASLPVALWPCFFARQLKYLNLKR